MRKADCTPEEWEAYKAYQAEWYRKQPPEKKAKIIERTYEYAHRHPQYRRNYHLKTKYGITLKQYHEMVEQQGNKCAICLRTPEENPAWATGGGVNRFRLSDFDVDHDHETGKIRGLLCNNCNNVLRGIYDDPDMLCRMAEYVARHRPVQRLVS